MYQVQTVTRDSLKVKPLHFKVASELPQQDPTWPCYTHHYPIPPAQTNKYLVRKMKKSQCPVTIITKVPATSQRSKN